jgi:hypothetical protein
MKKSIRLMMVMFALIPHASVLADEVDAQALDIVSEESLSGAELDALAESQLLFQTPPRPAPRGGVGVVRPPRPAPVPRPLPVAPGPRYNNPGLVAMRCTAAWRHLLSGDVVVHGELFEALPNDALTIAREKDAVAQECVRQQRNNTFGGIDDDYCYRTATCAQF